MFDKLYDVNENTHVNFIGFTTENTRYDFAFVYTDNFFGKPLVVCMQTGRSSLLCFDDLDNLDYLQRIFLINEVEAEELSDFLKQRIPSVPNFAQY
ncbi:DUF3055 domain-containing protein [Chengkuizengella axinellae]|uniref:DUF3055 domain-containing protein n=1 Tax=Chengkuizengella axinellae TaxID=3064388 RepID=A0ABT9IVD1_9BACL|nr:DUF3055 domain-containing protein [Chengkuizengella sp. 2205SS18-9]MDP5273292.1 DUF3055 domain-containing protein [Chengkuizengella sp. 2205SS18-9]